jgi:hypothetical protein
MLNSGSRQGARKQFTVEHGRRLAFAHLNHVYPPLFIYLFKLLTQ